MSTELFVILLLAAVVLALEAPTREAVDALLGADVQILHLPAVAALDQSAGPSVPRDHDGARGLDHNVGRASCGEPHAHRFRARILHDDA